MAKKKLKWPPADDRLERYCEHWKASRSITWRPPFHIHHEPFPGPSAAPPPLAEAGPFFTWLIDRSWDGAEWIDDSIGDLAMDAWRDLTFPRAAGSREAVRYIKGVCGFGPSIRIALAAMLREYRRALRSMPMMGYRNVLPAMRFKILQRDKYTCQTCGARAPNARLEIDHRIPVSRGGDSLESNLWTLCFDCNRGKSDSAL